MKTLLRNGFVVSGNGVKKQDILIDGEKITAMGSLTEPADKVVDMSGKYLFPKMKLNEYKGLFLPDLKNFAHNRVESVIYKDRELSDKILSRENSVGGRVLCEYIKR